MVEINVDKLKGEIEKLNSLINKYENTQLNLFNQLKDSCVNWYDGNSRDFESNINLEKVESSLLLKNLKDEKSVYKYIYSRYHEIGRKVKCELKYKKTIITKIEECYNLADLAIETFSGVDSSFAYSEYSLIMEQKNRIVNVKSKLFEIKTTMKTILDKIESIEKEVNAKIKELEEIKINDFDFVLKEVIDYE